VSVVDSPWEEFNVAISFIVFILILLALITSSSSASNLALPLSLVVVNFVSSKFGTSVGTGFAAFTFSRFVFCSCQQYIAHIGMVWKLPLFHE